MMEQHWLVCKETMQNVPKDLQSIPMFMQDQQDIQTNDSTTFLLIMRCNIVSSHLKPTPITTTKRDLQLAIALRFHYKMVQSTKGLG